MSGLIYIWSVKMSGFCKFVFVVGMDVVRFDLISLDWVGRIIFVFIIKF